MKKRHIIFLLLIVIGLVSIIFSITYALTTSVSEGTSSDYDLSYTFTISDDTWTVTVPADKTKVYEIALTNPYSDSIRYGVAYKINNSDISLEDVSITTTKDSSSLPEDLIGSNVNKNVSIMIENNSTSNIEVNLIIVNGYKNGGDLIIPEGYNLVEEYNSALITLTSLGLSVSEGTPDFSKTSCTDGCDESTVGIYKAQDDLGTSYYFRGDVENNYVYFAGFYWRIIRINGDGSIRMIYDGTVVHANGEIETDRAIGGTEYATNTHLNDEFGDNTYVGYMYGKVGATTYEETNSNTYDSQVKEEIDNWYSYYIKNKEYEQYVADAIYCNDREVLDGTGIGTNTTFYAAYERIGLQTPTLYCSQINDKFTISDTLGNGKLTNPVGLITIDEVAMAGSSRMTENLKYYLFTNYFFWTMTPVNNISLFLAAPRIGSAGPYFDKNNISASSTTRAMIRPVISISPNAIQYGNGTSTNPFRLTESV